jgi:hypothetical protein
MLDGQQLSSIVSSMNAEYTALRQEIGRCQDHQKDMMNFAFVLLGATFALIGVTSQLSEPDRRDVGTILLLVPVIYALLACASADRARRMIDLASYLHYDLGRRVRAISGYELWRWETFKSERYDHLHRTFKLQAKGLDKARWFIFVLPSLVALFAYFELAGSPSGLSLGLVCLDAILVVVSIRVLLLTEETSGLRNEQGGDSST